MRNELIRFDWAMKRLLRDKANYVIVEGLLTALLDKPIHIKSLLESEGNKEYSDDKFNRVDLLAENEHGELVIFEIQNDRELDYFHRMTYGVSKAITEYIKSGETYVLRVDEFDKVAATPLDEWISFLKTGDIPANATAPGLAEARERLHIASLSDEERQRYNHDMENLRYQRSVLYTGRYEGRIEGENQQCPQPEAERHFCRNNFQKFGPYN